MGVWKTRIGNVVVKRYPFIVKNRCRSASLQTPYCADVRNRRLKSPRLFNFPSSRRSTLTVHRSSLIVLILLSKYFNMRQSTCLWPFLHQKRDFHKTPQLGVSNIEEKKFSPTGNIFFPSWALFSAQLGVFLLIAHYNTEKTMSYCKSFSSKWQSIRLK